MLLLLPGRGQGEADGFEVFDCCNVSASRGEFIGLEISGLASAPNKSYARAMPRATEITTLDSGPEPIKAIERVAPLEEV